MKAFKTKQNTVVNFVYLSFGMPAIHLKICMSTATESGRTATAFSDDNPSTFTPYLHLQRGQLLTSNYWPSFLPLPANWIGVSRRKGIPACSERG
jgi:hypothetical protein